jgi:localization factor PodJL
MKSNSPWSVKGVEPEAREAAKLAARRAGVPVGVWLSNMIRKGAAEQLKSGGSAAPSYQAVPQAVTGSDTGSAQNGAGNHRPPAPTTEVVLESINRLAAKIEAAEVRTSEAIAPLADKVKELSEQMDEVKEHKALDSAPLERALARMSERLDHIEDGPRLAGKPPVDDRRRQGFLSRLFSD